MISPTEVIGEKQLISTPEYEWEMRQTPLINEAPRDHQRRYGECGLFG